MLAFWTCIQCVLIISSIFHTTTTTIQLPLIIAHTTWSKLHAYCCLISCSMVWCRLVEHFPLVASFLSALQDMSSIIQRIYMVDSACLSSLCCSCTQVHQDVDRSGRQGDSRATLYEPAQALVVWHQQGGRRTANDSCFTNLHKRAGPRASLYVCGHNTCSLRVLTRCVTYTD